MKNKMLVLVLFLLPSISLFAQDATVTFYSPHYTRKDALEVLGPVKSKIPFSGWIFDANHKVAEIQPNHFMTVRLPIGIYTFSASSSFGPGKNLLSLTLQSNGHYYVRLSDTYRNFVVVGFVQGTLQEVSCDAAHQEIPKAKPVKIKHVKHDYLNKLDSAASLPDCK